MVVCVLQLYPHEIILVLLLFLSSPKDIYFKFVDREKSFLWLYQMMEDRVIDDVDEGDGGSLLSCFRKAVTLCKLDHFFIWK